MRRVAYLLLPVLAGCASKPAPIAVVTPPVVAPVPVAPPPLPAGATPGMRIPAVLTDGSYPTPNRQLSPAATLWHLRAGLNVAALACQGVQGTTIIAGYNALLRGEKATLAAAEASYSAEFRAAGGDWRDRYDDEMTRLYNFFSQTPARGGLCAAAERTLATLSTAPAGSLSGVAGAELAGLDQPFTDFYRAYDAWRSATAVPAMPRVVIAAATPPAIAATPSGAMSRPIATTPAVGASVGAAPVVAARVVAKPTVAAPSPAAVPPTSARPRLELDPSVFADPVSPTR